jgi:hypothetical protein
MNYYKYKIGNNMKYALFSIMAFVLMSSMVMADSSICIDNSTARFTLTRMNYTSSSELVNLTWNKTCLQNCSTTLGTCRPDEPYQLIYFIVIFAASLLMCILGLYIGNRMGMLDMPIYLVITTFFAFMGGAFDVFNSQYNTAFLGFAIIPMAFFLYSLWRNISMRKDERRPSRGSGREL